MSAAEGDVYAATRSSGVQVHARGISGGIGPFTACECGACGIALIGPNFPPGAPQCTPKEKPAWGRVALGAAISRDFVGGAEEDRTPDLRIANATLSQLSYGPMMQNTPLR